MSTNNLILLAAEGFKYVKLFTRGPAKGEYIGIKRKSDATHRLHSTRPYPREERKNVPKNVIRVYYADPKNFTDFTEPDRREKADEWLKSRRELAANASPTSAVAVPFGTSYKNFVATRAKAASDGSLYDRTNKEQHNMAKAKPTPPSAKKKTKSDKPPAAPKDIKNGITRPKDGTTCAQVWGISEKLKDRAPVLAECAKKGINPATAQTQFGKWRTYNGLSGQTSKRAAAKKKPTPPSAKGKAKAKPETPAPDTTAPETPATGN